MLFATIAAPGSILRLAWFGHPPNSACDHFLPYPEPSPFSSSGAFLPYWEDRMPHLFKSISSWPLIVAAFTAIPPCALAKGGGAGAAAAADDDTDTDLEDDEVLNIGKGGKGKAPSHFAIKPSVRLGFRHYPLGSKDSSFEAFVRNKQSILDNSWSLRSSELSGGFVGTYKLGATTWMVTFQTGDVFSRFYEHTTRTNYDLRTTMQHSIDLGDGGWAVVPRVQMGYQWSSDQTQQRWKFQTTTPISYALGETVALMPLVPKLSYQPYTDRTDSRADWTVTVSAGIRWILIKPSFLQATLGYENRRSNVHNADFSRWVLTPQLNLRIEF
jgi:hypothetical protein